jgi:hypothetical protein
MFGIVSAVWSRGGVQGRTTIGSYLSLTCLRFQSHAWRDSCQVDGPSQEFDYHYTLTST